MADTTTRQARVYEVMDGSLIWNLKVQQLGRLEETCRGLEKRCLFYGNIRVIFVRRSHVKFFTKPSQPLSLLENSAKQ